MELLFKSQDSLVYLDKPEKNGDYQIVKLPTNPFPDPVLLEGFINELKITKDVDSPYIRKSIGQTQVDGKMAITLEYFPGKTLAEVYTGRIEQMDTFLNLAILITKAVSEIHQHNIIHKDLTPTNILYNPEKHELQIIDFGISRTYNQKVENLAHPDRLEGTLNYLSPEQTGRVNRNVDYRTDLYAIGVILYQLLTGHLPFEFSDSLELIHAHLAITPELPSNYRKEVTGTIDSILLKLLEKDAADRYKSAEGLLADLERYKTLYESGEWIDFAPGENDFSTRFLLPDKLYGVQAHIGELFGAFERIKENETQEQVEAIFVSGFSGVGKSSLVKEIHYPVTKGRGIFISGKFDQLQRNIPYFAIIQAFQQLVNHLLVEDEEVLAKWKERIMEGLGNNGRVITNLVPQLERIIGEQAPVPELGANEAQIRFNLLINRFFKSITSKETPIVLFIDDLQWADPASLDLLQLILLNKEIPHFLFIGGYRDNEVDVHHPLTALLTKLEEKEHPFINIELSNLSKKDVSHLIADTLGEELETVFSLAELTTSKTGGNAFFTRKFLQSLYEEQLIQFDTDQAVKLGRAKWQWDTEKIREQNITDNIITLLSKKIKTLPLETQHILKVGACIGNQFLLSELIEITSSTSEEIKDLLLNALQEGFIQLSQTKVTGQNLEKEAGSSLQHEYQFVHDQIQQAVYALIPEAETKQYHLQIGKLLYKKLSKEDQREIFAVVNHFNQAQSLIKTKAERIQIAQLNLEACYQAKSNAAFDTAYKYIKQGISFLPDDTWQHHYPITMEMHTAACEAAWMSTNFEEMDQLVEITLANCKDLLESVRIKEIQMHVYISQLTPGAVEMGLELLEQLGHKFNPHPKDATVALHLFKTMGLIRGRKPGSFINLPELSDPTQIAIVRICSNLIGFCYLSHPKLFPLLVFQIVRTCIRHGINTHANLGFGMYGVVLGSVLGKMKRGIEFGLLADAILERFPSVPMQGRNLQIRHYFFSHWENHLKDDVEGLMKAHTIGIECGDLQEGFVAGTSAIQYDFLCGRNLKEIEQRLIEYDTFASSLQQEHSVKINRFFKETLLDLMEVKEHYYYTSDALHFTDNGAINAANIFFKLLITYQIGDYHRCLELLEIVKRESYMDSIMGTTWVPYFHFYQCLSLIGFAKKSSKTLSRAQRKQVLTNLKKMKSWVAMGSPTYQHQYELMQAEWLNLQGKYEKAFAHYNRAIEKARKHGFIQEEAIANEQAGKLALQEENYRLASHYIYDAYLIRERWGANALVARMWEDYPEQLAQATASTNSLITKPGKGGTLGKSNKGSNSIGSELDLQTILKASTAISSEMHLSALLEKMMQFILQNAGATYGALILNKKEGLVVEAELHSNKGEVQTLHSIPVEASENLANSVVMYVYRSQEEEVLNDISNTGRFTNDPYVLRAQPKSVLCIPILYQTQLSAILFLENDLMKGAFTQQRIALLNLLTGQIAVSIHNALAYENLESLVAERTQEIEDEKAKSEDLLLNLLPKEVAEELKIEGTSKPRRFDEVSILFTDFVGFTNIAEGLSPEQLVSAIDTCFTHFDNIVIKHGLEKIKTIGDAYMVAGGLPTPNDQHAIQIVKAAFDIIDFMEDFNRKAAAKGEPVFNIRIGAHSGPVIAGVVGNLKFAYDIWGDAVNLAARMESTSEAGKVNVSAATYELIKDEFNCNYRGKLKAKHKGEVDMYFVERA